MISTKSMHLPGKKGPAWKQRKELLRSAKSPFPPAQPTYQFMVDANSVMSLLKFVITGV